MAFMHRWGCDLNRVRLTMAGLGVCLIACSATICLGASDQGVLLDLRDARLQEVVSMLTAQSGANIVILPEAAEKRVTAHIDGLPLDTVLDLVVRDTAGVDYYRTDDGTYVIGRKRPVNSTVPAVEPVQAPAQAVSVAELKTVMIPLTNSDPVELLALLNVRGFESTYQRFYAANAGRISTPVGWIDADTHQMGVINQQRMADGSINYVESPGINADTALPTVDLGYNNGSGRTANSGDGMSQYTGARSAPSAGTSGRTQRPRPTTPGTTTASPNTNSNNLLPDGVDMVMPVQHDNSLIVRGTEDGIAKLKDIVHMLDVPPKQVSIKAEFIEVTTSDVKNLGIDWSLERLNSSFNTNFGTNGNVIVGLTTGNLAASIAAELTRTTGKVINSPIISTINNEPATIQIGSSIPYWTSYVQVTDNGNITQSSPSQLQVTTQLNVLPRVNGDGTITLMLMPQVEDTGAMFTAPDGQSQIPETRTQSLSTRRRVMSGETIVVGGFIRKTDSQTNRQVPILASLPFIGKFFQANQNQAEDRELLIFITPTIISEKSAGSAIGVSTLQ